MPDSLPHERLDVYRCAIEWAALANDFVKKLPRGESELRDQLRRASLSIPLNIAEGVGKGEGADRARYHRIARGSVLECAALVDVMGLLGVLEREEQERGKELLRRLSNMLTVMCR